MSKDEMTPRHTWNPIDPLWSNEAIDKNALHRKGSDVLRGVIESIQELCARTEPPMLHLVELPEERRAELSDEQAFAAAFVQTYDLERILDEALHIDKYGADITFTTLEELVGLCNRHRLDSSTDN